MQKRGGWMSTNSGSIDFLSADMNSVKRYIYDSTFNQSVYLKPIVKDKEGRVWIGTENEGLYLFDPLKKAFEH